MGVAVMVPMSVFVLLGVHVDGSGLMAVHCPLDAVRELHRHFVVVGPAVELISENHRNKSLAASRKRSWGISNRRHKGLLTTEVRTCDI